MNREKDERWQDSADVQPRSKFLLSPSSTFVNFENSMISEPEKM